MEGIPGQFEAYYVLTPKMMKKWPAVIILIWPCFPKTVTYTFPFTHQQSLPRFHSRFLHTSSFHKFPSLKDGPSLIVSNTKKVRVGDLLVDQGLAMDAKHASALIMAGSVIADECTRIDSAATKVDPTTRIRIRGQKSHQWVSRGGLKLEHAIKHFNCTVEGKIALDIGCSTGGFTHVLLEAGIQRVYSVDVGYGQLALTLRNDPRVVVLERCNARNLTVDLVPEEPQVVVCDASFIPLHKVLPAALSLCKSPAILLALIKPQFEAQRSEIESGTGGTARQFLMRLPPDSVASRRLCSCKERRGERPDLPRGSGVD